MPICCLMTGFSLIVTLELQFTLLETSIITQAESSL